MWILPKQLHTSAFVLDTKALGLDSEEFSQISEKSLTWRGKDSLSRTWLLRLKRVSWMQHLCSRTLKPSHTESFLDAWTSSLGDSRVSLSRLLENVKQQKTQDTSSLTSQKESENVNLELFSSKMLQESSQPKPQTENQFSNMSSENWKAWVTEQRQEYSQRKKLAHLTREKESLSWATPNTMDVLPARCPEKLAKAKKKGGCKNLREEVMNWQTPTTMDIERTPEGMKKRKAYRESIGRKYVEGCLTEQVKNWLTPRVLEVDEDYESYQKRMQESGNPKNVGKKNPANLTMQVKNWPTARTSDAEGGRIDTEMTEQGFKSKRHKSNQTFGAKLRDAVETHEEKGENWPTARARDYKDTPGCAPSKIGDVSLPRKVYGLPDQQNNSTNGKSRGSLNPNWVEQLMGMPVGWTDLGSWETESSPQPQPKHSSPSSND
jgi:hypothetical protein